MRIQLHTSNIDLGPSGWRLLIALELGHRGPAVPAEELGADMTRRRHFEG